MNDFTKEELEELCDAVRSYSRAKWYVDLEEKIQSMIDDYPSIYCKCKGQWVCDECNYKAKKQDE